MTVANGKHLPLSHPLVKQRLERVGQPEPEPNFDVHDAWVVEMDEAIEALARDVQRMAVGAFTVGQRRLLRVIAAELLRRAES